MTSNRQTTTRRDWLTIAGLVVVGVSTVIASFSSLAGLAVYAGWHQKMAILLPATVDVYGVTATRIWLSAPARSEVRAHARGHAFVALTLSMLGNAVNHAVEAHALNLGDRRWLLIVAVSLVPPVASGALMHLVAVRGKDQSAAAGPPAEMVRTTLPPVDLNHPDLVDQTTPASMDLDHSEHLVRTIDAMVVRTTPEPLVETTAEATVRTTPETTQRTTGKGGSKTTVKGGSKRKRRTREELRTELEHEIAELYRLGGEIQVLPLAKKLKANRTTIRELLDEMHVRPIRKESTG